VRRLPICRNLLFDAPAATRQPTPSHIWHLINIHRAAIALPASHQCSTHRPSLAGRPCLFSYLANRWRRYACSRGRRVADSCTPSARQMRQDIVNHEPTLNTVVRHSDNDPGRAVFIGPPWPGAHKHCRYSHQYLGGPTCAARPRRPH